MTFANPGYLVETDWLEAHLGDPDLRILDCTIDRQTDADGVVRLASGRGIWEQGHIPGSVFADFVEDLSDRESKRAASRSGVSCGMVITGVVIRSAAVKARNGLAAARVVAVCMVDFLLGECRVPDPFIRSWSGPPATARCVARCSSRHRCRP